MAPIAMPVREASASLIPGLTEDVALLCLAHLPLAAQFAARAVSPAWRRALEGDDICFVRKEGGLAESILLFSDPLFEKCPPSLRKLFAFDTSTRSCVPIPPSLLATLRQRALPLPPGALALNFKSSRLAQEYSALIGGQGDNHFHWNESQTPPYAATNVPRPPPAGTGWLLEPPRIVHAIVNKDDMVHVFSNSSECASEQSGRLDIYDPVSEKWSTMTALKVPRDRCGRGPVVAVGGQFFGLLSSGHDGHGTCSIAKLDIESATWRVVADVPMPEHESWSPSVSEADLACIGEQIFVILKGVWTQRVGFCGHRRLDWAALHVLGGEAKGRLADADGRDSASWVVQNLVLPKEADFLGIAEV